ncbi:UNVERIFIED_CONTAM: hypothetical protein Sradi_1762800 [Sesamum radiatum]|uniref:DUF4283 domain-containing protein n=1 Tax=Sesamum radiatum TaxID=300843 RepID=A0AAW2TUR2_SESRA
MEKEDVGLVSTGLWHTERMAQGFFIVGRVLSNKTFHPEALHSTLKSAFNPVKGMEFKMIEGNRFLLKFFHSLDRDHVIARNPWTYEKTLLILAPVNSSNNPIEIDLNHCEFHIHIPRLPLGKDD